MELHSGEVLTCRRRGQRRRVTLLLRALVLASCCAPGASQYDMNYDMSYSQYYYDPRQPEESLPTITSEEQHLSVPYNSSVTLPCAVSSLEDYNLVWQHGDSILWVLKGSLDDPLDPEFQRVSENERVGRNGTHLTLREARLQDQGSYTCRLETDPPRFIIHTLTVTVPPSVSPANGKTVVTVKMGLPAYLGCNAHGNPKPTVTWRKRGGRLRGLSQGANLTIEATQPSDNGVYLCTADNGVGSAATTDVTLQVMYPPKVQAERSKVYSGAGYDATLACLVEGEPMSKVEWFRIGDIPVDPTRLIKAMDARGRYSLQFSNVLLADFGKYSCNASNFMGNSSAVISLLGNPKPTKYVSQEQGEKDTNYTLVWEVESYSPVLTYTIAYRNESEDDSEEQWVNLTVPGTSSSSIYHSMSHTFTQLDPGASYSVLVTATNEFGEGEVNEAFTFTTYDPAGTDPPDDPEGGAATLTSDSSKDLEEAPLPSPVPPPSPDAADAPSVVVGDGASRGASSFTLTPAERRTQTMAFVTAISLSCFFS